MHDAEIARHLREKGLSYKRISYKLNCDTKTVYRWLNPEYKQREYARKREKRRRKALSGYNALAERLALVGACYVDDRHEDAQKTIAEASAAIRSLSASLAAVTAERDEALERAHSASDVADLAMKQRNEAVAERDEARAEVSRLTPYVEAFRREERRADLSVERYYEVGAERDEAIRQREQAVEARAHDIARQSSIIAFLRKRRGQLVIERDEAIRQRDQAVEALNKIEATPAWGAPERWETTPAEVRQLARATIAAIREQEKTNGS
jgi:predicted transcriptional regulator